MKPRRVNRDGNDTVLVERRRTESVGTRAVAVLNEITEIISNCITTFALNTRRTRKGASIGCQTTWLYDDPLVERTHRYNFSFIKIIYSQSRSTHSHTLQCAERNQLETMTVYHYCRGGLLEIRNILDLYSRSAYSVSRVNIVYRIIV
jgi:hypothetical protein